jgi:hypothetical protein
LQDKFAKSRDLLAGTEFAYAYFPIAKIQRSSYFLRRQWEM